jgi:DNA-binding transcriptional regulator LsrR (DeoR family)
VDGDAVKLTPEMRAAILAEMRLAELFNTKRWSERYGISRSTVKRLRAEARERPLPRMGPIGPETARILLLTGPQPQKTPRAA